MSRHTEFGPPFEAAPVGQMHMELGQPIRMLVKEESARPRYLPGSFWVFTAKYVEEISGAKGIRLQGGVIVPWDNLERRGGLVIVRLFRDPHGATRPIVDLQSLLRIP